MNSKIKYVFVFAFFLTASLLQTTYVDKISCRCAICGHESEQWRLLSTNGSGDNDLDSRPIGMVRGTIVYDVRRCPQCGYCAEDIASADNIARKIVKRANYIKQLKDKEFPELANSFLCMAKIEKEKGHFSDAVWSTVNAAWACDDEGKAPQGAMACRKAAVELICLAEKANQPLFENETDSMLFQIDLLRRSGQFDLALNLIESKKNSLTNENLNRIIGFQRKLCLEKDIRCYRISDIFKEK